MVGDAGDLSQLLQKAAEGDTATWGLLLEQQRPRLRRMVALRLDTRLRGRLDPSDVIQETYLEASARLADYLQAPTMPFFLWLRFLAAQKLLTLHRRHFGVQMRDPARETAWPHGQAPEASSFVLAEQFLDRDPRPSEAAIRAELKERLLDALNHLEPLDREVLALRHFEHLSRAETAQVLGIREAAASKRYTRALQRLRDILIEIPGALSDLEP